MTIFTRARIRAVPGFPGTARKPCILIQSGFPSFRVFEVLARKTRPELTWKKKNPDTGPGKV